MPIFRTCFPEKNYRAWRKEMKNITASLGHARDLDVQIAFLHEYLQRHPGDGAGGNCWGISPGNSPADVPALLCLLQRKREEVQPAVEAAAAALGRGAPLHEFGDLLASPPRERPGREKSGKLYQRAQKTITSRTAGLLVYEQWVSDPDAVTRHHEMRIAAKRLRYTLEAFNRLYSGTLKSSHRKVRALQDILGMLHDCDVWIGYLTGFLEEPLGTIRPGETGRPGISRLLEDRKRERVRLYRTFVEMWNGMRDAHVFETLEEKVAQPLPDEAGDEIPDSSPRGLP
jgi:CHAD domain-containing protein